jgi:hypothetical protein
MKKIYQWRWSHEGIIWRRENFLIMEPHGIIKKWRLRKVGGKPGMQRSELEADCMTAKDAFQLGNQMIRLQKKGK